MAGTGCIASSAIGQEHSGEQTRVNRSSAINPACFYFQMTQSFDVSRGDAVRSVVPAIQLPFRDCARLRFLSGSEEDMNQTFPNPDSCLGQADGGVRPRGLVQIFEISARDAAFLMDRNSSRT